jgi:predicted Zn-dependent peptidase
VTHPYFTKETVEKEQGIIGQEIRMYEDDPGWRVMFNLLQSLYQNNSVKVDIAGSIESIAQIDAELLYRCYHTFYNLHNMVLTIAGNFDPQQVIESADKILKPAEPFCVQRKTEDEPAQVCRKRFVQHLPVAVPMFYIGFKGPNEGERQNFCNMLMDEMILDIVTGETTELYKQLYNDGLINGGIIGETMPGRDYLCSMISGESRDPDQVYERICAEFERVKQEGINQKTFEQVKKSTYGRYLGLFSKPESLASAMNNCYFAGLDVYELVEMVASTTKEQLEQRLKRDFCTEYSSLSIVMA